MDSLVILLPSFSTEIQTDHKRWRREQKESVLGCMGQSPQLMSLLELLGGAELGVLMFGGVNRPLCLSGKLTVSQGDSFFHLTFCVPCLYEAFHKSLEVTLGFI